MSKISLIITLFFTLVTAACFAQRRDTTVNYMSNTGVLANSRATADFIRILIPPDSVDKDLTIINDFYMSGKRKFTGRTHNAVSYELTNLEGAFIEYFENGHRKSIANFKNGRAAGDVIKYYPNGQIYTIVNTGMLMLCQDSTGKVFASDGSGKWIKFDESFGYIAEGPVSKGLADGIWKSLDNGKERVSIYKQGSFVSGADIEMDTKNILRKVNGKVGYQPEGIYETKPDVIPIFKDGDKAFAEFLIKNIKYPRSARQDRVEGRVIVTFMVEKNGALSGIKVLRGISPDCNTEALRVIQLSSPWKPGAKNGQPVRVAFSIPINFTLEKKPDVNFQPEFRAGKPYYGD